MKRVAIVGGGISGLSAAFSLEEKRHAGAALDYIVFEASSRLGGVLVTGHADGCLIEAGPDSFLTEKPWAIDLCRQVGLGDQLIGSNDSQRKTYILVNGRPVVMPDGLMFMVPTKILPTVFSPLFSLRTKWKMASEWFHPPHKAKGDETVASFVERHYGAEMVDRLADPLLSGVYGGEASNLSLRAVLPRFAEMESKYGSLGQGMLAARKKMMQMSKAPARPLFTSLKDGMQQLVDAVLARLPEENLRPGAAVNAIRPSDGGWLLKTGDASEHFDAVIVATPARAAAKLLQEASPVLASELAGIEYSSSITVTLGYGPNVRSSLPPGFGFLVPRSQGKRMLAATFVHNKFPHRAPDNRALIRCFLGGARDEQIMNASEDEIVRIVRTELRQILGLTAEPLFVRLYKWKAAMAQYAVGHLDRLQRIQQAVRNLPGLALAGNGYSGIGVPDCVRSGSEAVATVLVNLGISQPQAQNKVPQSV